MAEGLTRHIQEVDSVPRVRGQLMRKDIAGRLCTSTGPAPNLTYAAGLFAAVVLQLVFMFVRFVLPVARMAAAEDLKFSERF